MSLRQLELDCAQESSLGFTAIQFEWPEITSAEPANFSATDLVCQCSVHPQDIFSGGQGHEFVDVPQGGIWKNTLVIDCHLLLVSLPSKPSSILLSTLT